MVMLHTVNKSPFERNTLETCLRLAPKGGTILLLEDGVTGALRHTEMVDKVKAAASDYKLCVLGPDVKARGFDESNIIDEVKVVDYDGFVDLVVEHESVQAWL